MGLGYANALGVKGGFDALADIIAERKKDEILRFNQEQQLREFEAQQRQQEETRRWQQLQYESLNTDREERRKLALQTQSNVEAERQRADADRDEQRTIRLAADTPGGTRLDRPTYERFKQAGIGGVTPNLATTDEMGAPTQDESWTYAGGTNWQAREAAAKAAVVAREEAFQNRRELMGIAAAMKANQPLTPYQKAMMERTLGNDFRKETAAYHAMGENLTNMESAYKRALTGQRVGTDEAIIVMFEKALDPNSVVREGEYARVGGGAPLLDRMKQILVNVGVGGTLSPEHLRTLVDLSRDFTMNAKAYADSAKARTDEFAHQYGLDTARVYGTLVEPPAAPADPNKPRAVSATPRPPKVTKLPATR